MVSPCSVTLPRSEWKVSCRAARYCSVQVAVIKALVHGNDSAAANVQPAISCWSCNVSQNLPGSQASSGGRDYPLSGQLAKHPDWNCLWLGRTFQQANKHQQSLPIGKFFAVVIDYGAHVARAITSILKPVSENLKLSSVEGLVGGIRC